MTSWVRYRHRGFIGFGTLDNGEISVHSGDMFDAPKPAGTHLVLGEVELLAPTQPSKIVALWNNFHALAAKLNVAEPAEPLLSAESANIRHGPRCRRSASEVL